MINIKDFISSLPKLDKKIIQKQLQRWRLQHCIHYNINSINPLYLIISNADGYIEENNQNKYLVFLLRWQRNSNSKTYKTLGRN